MMLAASHRSAQYEPGYIALLFEGQSHCAQFQTNSRKDEMLLSAKHILVQGYFSSFFMLFLCI